MCIYIYICRERYITESLCYTAEINPNIVNQLYTSIKNFFNKENLKRLFTCSSQGRGFPSGSVVKNSPSNIGDKETWVQSLAWEDPLEKEMAIHSSLLACKIPWAEETGGLQSTVHGVVQCYTTEQLSSQGIPH